jgi:hypothetical protein
MGMLPFERAERPWYPLDEDLEHPVMPVTKSK